jgi:hypothetical protein
VEVVVMTTDMAAFEAALLLNLELDAGRGADTVESWLHDPSRTAHRLVTLPTAQLVEQALGTTSAPEKAPAATPALPGGMWRVLPDRLLALHPARRGEVAARLRIPVARHLELTATVLERWGWARTQTRHTAKRTVGGRRCIVGAQYAVHRLGYGTEHTASEAGRQIQGVLAGRGVSLPYPEWNELPTTTGPMALAIVRVAVKGAS